MKRSDGVLLVAVLCMVPAVMARASNGPPGSSIGQSLAVITETLPVVITGQGTALQQATPVAVVIDIQPNRTPNLIALNRNYTVYVAVLGSSEFDVTDLDPETIGFGRTGEEAGAVRPPVIRDLNGDGFDDALYGFMTFDCGFEPGDVVGLLKALKADEAPVEGSDSIVISP